MKIDSEMVRKQANDSMRAELARIDEIEERDAARARDREQWYRVRVEFAFGGSRVVRTTPHAEDAEQEALRYMADSKGVWIDGPNGTRDLKEEDRVRRYGPPR